MATSPKLTDPSTSTRRDHVWSLQYLRLVAVAIFIRSSVYLVNLALAKTGARAYPQVQRTWVKIPSRDGSRSISAYRYERIDSARSAKKRNVHLNWHGSGWVIPGLGSEFEFCSLLAQELDLIVYDCDYRKSPMNPFPAAIEDVEDAVLWALARRDSEHDVQRGVSLSGFSAGGNLALSGASLFGGEDKQKRISSVVAIYPITDARPSSFPKRAPIKTSGAIPTPWLNFFFDAYLTQPSSERFDPRVSVIVNPHTAFPPTVFVGCGNGDTLYDDGASFIKVLNEAGHPDATFEHVEGEGHGFDRNLFWNKVRRAKMDSFYAKAVEAVKRGLEGASQAK